MAKTPDSYLVAVDDGYAQTKVYGAPLSGGEPVKAVFRTSARPGRHAIRGIGSEGALGLYKTEEGEEFTVSESVGAESTTFDGFHLSTLNRAVVHHGLIQAGYEGKAVDLITGLPVSDYFQVGGTVNDERIDAKKANLKKGIERSQGGPTAQLASVTVGCQAVAAFFDFMIGDDLKPRGNMNGRFAIVDIGGRTTDIAVIVDGKALDEANSGSANQGALDVYKALNDAICQEHRLRTQFPVAELAEAVRSGTFEIWGKPTDVNPLVRQAVGQVQANIQREIERRLGGVAATLKKVIFVGGGSGLFKDIQSLYPNGVTVEDPEFANARGLYKFAALKLARAKAA